MRKIKMGCVLHILTFNNQIISGIVISVDNDKYTVLYRSNIGATEDFTEDDLGETVFWTFDEAYEKIFEREREV